MCDFSLPNGPEQLPDIPNDKIVCHWKTFWPNKENGLTWPIVIITHEGRELWRGRTVYENSRQFAEICKLFRTRYPGRFYDFEYQGEEGMFLGDDYDAIPRMKKAHRLNRGNYDERVLKDKMAEKGEGESDLLGGG